MRTIIFIIALLPGLVQADWTRADTWRQSAYAVFLTGDWLQTREITRNDDYVETNSILGDDPSIGTVNNYFLASGLAHTAIAYVLPPEYRKAWQYVFIGMHVGAVNRNYQLGIKARF